MARFKSIQNWWKWVATCFPGTLDWPPSTVWSPPSTPKNGVTHESLEGGWRRSMNQQNKHLFFFTEIVTSPKNIYPISHWINAWNAWYLPAKLGVLKFCFLFSFFFSTVHLSLGLIHPEKCIKQKWAKPHFCFVFFFLARARVACFKTCKQLWFTNIMSAPQAEEPGNSRRLGLQETVNKRQTRSFIALYGIM